MTAANKRFATNRAIKSRTVQLIDADGINQGTQPLDLALKLADEADMDLVEIVASAVPPICKILDYGKFQYAEQKKASEARKKQRVVEIKEIKLRPVIDDHDYDTKMKAVSRFIEEGHKVKFTLKYRGREMAHQNIGCALFNRIRDQFAQATKVELHPSVQGRQMTMILAPS